MKFKISKLFLIAVFLLKVTFIFGETTVTVGITHNPPLVYQDESGEPAGLFVDVLIYIGTFEGWTFEYKYGTLTEVMDWVESGEVDVLPDLGYSAEREERFLFNDEVLIATWAQVYTTPDHEIDSILDLDGLTIAIQDGDYFIEDPEHGLDFKLEQFGLSAFYVPVDDYDDVLELLDNGDVDAGVVNRIYGEVNAKKYDVQKTSVIYSPVSLHYAFTKDSEHTMYLKERLDAQLKRQLADNDSFLYDIIDNYLNYSVDFRIPAWVFWLIGGVSLLMLISFLISALLSIEVRLKSSALVREKRLLWSITELSPIGLCELDYDGKLRFINPKMKEIIKYLDTDCLPYKRIIDKRESILNYHHIVDRPNADKMIIVIHGKPVYRKHNKTTAIFALEDITDVVRSKEVSEAMFQQLKQLEKVEIFGRLTAGIAHDFNNALTILRGNVQLLQYEFKDHINIFKYIHEIEQAINLASNLVRQLSDFNHRENQQFRQIDINDIIKNSMNMIKILVGKSIVVDYELTQEKCLIYGNSSNIKQVIINLLANARDSMKQGGTINIRTNIIENKNFEILPEKKYVLLSIKDSGMGIKQEVINNIFDLFFTTKEVGKGTGVGLAITNDIVSNHNGVIHVSSVVNEGTVFRVYIPYVGNKKDIHIEKKAHESNN